MATYNLIKIIRHLDFQFCWQMIFRFIPTVISFYFLFKAVREYLLFDRSIVGFSALEVHQIVLWNFVTDYVTAVDGLSLIMRILTAFIFFICNILTCKIYRVGKNFDEAFIALSVLLGLMQSFLGNIFELLDLFYFYVNFEAILIPMFLLIGHFGSRERRIVAAYYFFLYTLVTSMLIFISLYYINSTIGSTLYPLLNQQPFAFNTELLLCLAFFVTFATKVPMIPVHLWLPEAHVESPTVGSVILAALLLKLGGFGFLRYSLPFFVEANQYMVPLVYILALIGIIYASLTTIRQFDLKKIIAYSSVAHMNLSVLGVYAFTQQGLDGSIYLMVGHGIVSSALFICIGVLYDRYHSRLLPYYGGLVTVMPLFAFFFFIFTLGNMGFPGTVNFIGEFLLYTGIFDRNSLIGILATPAIVFSAVYSGWLYNRVIFGTLKTKYISHFSDLTNEVIVMLLIFAVATIYFGVSGSAILDTIYPTTKSIALYY